MNIVRVIAIVLILGGAASLAWGRFSYTRATHEARVGPFEFGVKEKKTVDIPKWAGMVAIAAGAALLLVPKRA